MPPETIQPKWRPFQLAFLLMNLPGIADPGHADREVVDLLFFPTGGGKTEAYLGPGGLHAGAAAAAEPRHRSRRDSSVLMRYTLRLLTLDQLGRAATLICALELERQKDVEKLGEWPFEIGLWVGRAATPNRMGQKGDNDQETARAKTIAFKNDDRKPRRSRSRNAPGAARSSPRIPSSSCLTPTIRPIFAWAASTAIATSAGESHCRSLLSMSRFTGGFPAS